MTFDSRRSSASQKHWSLNWWDLWPLVDGERRPIQWTNSSMIFSSHPTSPLVVARSFPSASPIFLPSPNPVINNPSAFSPPSIIEVSSGDEYVFAFFEGRGGDHSACVWQRDETLDTWKVSIFWAVRPGQAIVSAKWLGNDRPWLHNSAPTRTPPLGPTNPFSKPSLLIVTQGHVVQIVHRPSPSLPFQLVAASLRHASQAIVHDRPFPGETTNGPGGLSVCVKAAIGLGYGESSIIIATYSTLIPPTSASNPELPDHFGVQVPPVPPPISPSASSWENFGLELAIHLCEIKITAYNFILGVATKPLPPLFPPVTSSSHLCDILIIPHLTMEEMSNPGGSIMDSDHKGRFKSWMHIVLNFLDFEDYLSPKSNLMCFELKRSTSPPTESSKPVTWIHRHLHTRTITNAAVSFLLPPRSRSSDAVTAGVLDIEGFTPKSSTSESKSREIGKIIRLRIPDLMDDEDWEPSRLMTRTDDAAADPPLSAALSPLESFICTTPAMWSCALKIGIHPHPRQKNNTATLNTLSEALLTSILSNRSPSDITHVLTAPTFPLSSILVVVENTFHTVHSSNLPRQDWDYRMVGIILEIYRNRSKRISKESPGEWKEQQFLDERWQVAHDICSLRALKGAFDACKEDNGYDLDPVWHLIALLTWLVDFAERLVRTCVLWEASVAVRNAHSSKEASQDKDQGVKVKLESMEIDRDDLFDGELSPPPDALSDNSPSSLIHIIHPYTLDNLTSAIHHLNTFRAYLDTLTPSKLRSSIAKEVIIDVIDCSGINYKELESALRKVKKLDEFTELDADTFQRYFCSLSPGPSIQALLAKASSLVTSPAAVSKPRLFIKPSELVDGISKLNLETAKMNQERDVVSKGPLGVPSAARICARCNGKTETGRIPLPRGKEISRYGSWAVWEHEWTKCICGGSWMREKPR